MESLTLFSLILGLFLGLMTVLFIFRIILTWYPQVNLQKFPWKAIARPTEPLLIPVRKLVPPIGGVDISPIIWVAICTLLREILLGQQGLIAMASRMA